MAKKSNIITGTVLAPASNGKSAAMQAVSRLLLSAKTFMQSMAEFEKDIQSALVKTLEHCEIHGDAMPADRLVKGLRELNHPAMTKFSDECVAWFRINSPIRWNAKGDVRVLKEGEEGYKPFDVHHGEEEAFNETPQAKRARQAADAAHKRTLQPVTAQDVLNRIKGVVKFVENAQNPDRNGDVRGIAAKEGKKIKALIKDLSAFVVDHGGVSPDVNIEEPAQKKAA